MIVIAVGPVGTTSACAENTRRLHLPGRATRNYLRMRGEYLEEGFSPRTHEELPPHARRIPSGGLDCGECGGTTSACAENTL